MRPSVAPMRLRHRSDAIGGSFSLDASALALQPCKFRGSS
jgi:hypothetical protein